MLTLPIVTKKTKGSHFLVVSIVVREQNIWLKNIQRSPGEEYNWAQDTTTRVQERVKAMGMAMKYKLTA
jgi:hypothetical protein